MSSQDQRLKQVISAITGILVATVSPLTSIPTPDLYRTIKSGLYDLLDLLEIDTAGIRTKSKTIEIEVDPD